MLWSEQRDLLHYLKIVLKSHFSQLRIIFFPFFFSTKLSPDHLGSISPKFFFVKQKVASEWIWWKNSSFNFDQLAAWNWTANFASYVSSNSPNLCVVYQTPSATLHFVSARKFSKKKWSENVGEIDPLSSRANLILDQQRLDCNQEDNWGKSRKRKFRIQKLERIYILCFFLPFFRVLNIGVWKKKICLWLFSPIQMIVVFVW